MISQYGTLLAIGVAAALLGLTGWIVWRRKRGPELKRAIEAVAIERLQNVLLPDGMGGHIQV